MVFLLRNKATHQTHNLSHFSQEVYLVCVYVCVCECVFVCVIMLNMYDVNVNVNMSLFQFSIHVLPGAKHHE